jgi:alkanesulfonate monooxygenase SsuD/methylene tetrahydromethanopterin reductase-like flavin-dependent oxidoreductase (luciferase family)
MTPTPSPGSPQFFVFLPQMRLGIDDLVTRARTAEAHGFTGMAFMDHLAPPMAEDRPMYEAMTVATWVAAHTTTLAVGHLVLCDALRHPAVLAKQAITLDHASGGRFELGLGWGSVPAELPAYGLTSNGPAARVQRLGETLDLVDAFWSGGPVHYDGAHFQVDAPGQAPPPLGRIPIVIGGIGPKTLALVRRHADWWNLQLNHLDRLDELRPQVGDARVSTQNMVAFVPDEGARAEVDALAQRRFGMMGPGLVVGNAAELVDNFGELHRRGVDRFYIWFADFAPPETLAAFGDSVVAPLQAP